jgi:hypothetical protein
VETLPRLTGVLIQRLTEKGVVSLTEIKQYLSELGNLGTQLTSLTYSFVLLVIALEIADVAIEEIFTGSFEGMT